MKPRSTVLLATTAISFFLLLSRTVVAQAQPNTSTADSPYLRRPQQTPPSKIAKMSDKDVQFISSAGAHNESEIEYAKMAERKAQSAEVKKLAARIANDHVRMNNELVAFAAKKGVLIKPGTVKAQSIGEKDFDKTYLQMVEKAHQDDIGQYEKQGKTGNDADLRAWAAKTLPTLRAHLAMIREALKSVK